MNSLEIVKGIKPCEFKYRKSNGVVDDDRTHFGFIAQEINTIFPRDKYGIVSMDNNGYLMVDSTELIPILLKCIQELNERIEKLENVR
jgi:hypothetical protein